MKKMIMTMAIAVSTLSAFAMEGEVSTKVLNAFNTEFSQAKEVAWTVTDQYSKAAFNFNGKYVFAYYNTDGELLALTRYLSPDNLPLGLLNNLKKKYANYWISDLIEVAKGYSTQYFITVENADSKIVLEASDNSWVVNKKERKA